ncbi:MAG: hypothetical protein KGQ42_01325, partial [Alphaproteobacteria bacterium]|nr:hypothetical protein [Alphaproteobacteria bacterium]
MGWLIFLAMAFLLGGALLRFGHMTARGWIIVAAMLACGALGYGLQGRPELESSPVASAAADPRLNTMIE